MDVCELPLMYISYIQYCMYVYISLICDLVKGLKHNFKVLAKTS